MMKHNKFSNRDPDIEIWAVLNTKQKSSSGLLKCSKCGYTIRFLYKTDKENH